MLFKLILICLVSVITVRGFDVIGNIPIRRQEFSIKDAPYMAYVAADIRDEEGELAGRITDRNFCSAVIISPNWILTAAHCVNRSEPFDISVRRAFQYAPSLFNTHFEQQVKKSVVHERYSKDEKGLLLGSAYFNDIALLKLAKSIDTNFEKPIRLATSKDMPQIGQKVTRLGYGDDGEKPIHFNSIPLQTAEEEVISQEECQKLYRRSEISSFLCSDNIDGGDCPGDSGGAVVSNGKLVGIIAHSFYTNCRRGRKTFGPDLATRVDLYYDWIVQHVGKDELAQ